MVDPVCMQLLETIRGQLRRNLPCRGCLSPIDASAVAGLCGACWRGLIPLPEGRCPRCALLHEVDTECPDPVAWTFGDALWDYHGGRPPFGALLLPGIKNGELGWRRALLKRISEAKWPEFATGTDLVTATPTAFHRRWMRGFDLAEDIARLAAQHLQLPFAKTLRRSWTIPRQAGRTERERRRLPRTAIQIRQTPVCQGKIVLLVDDVWTTGTTLLQSARALTDAGATEVRVMTIFRAIQGLD